MTTRTVEPYTIERRLPHWYVHTWDVDRDAPRSYRLDRTRKAKALRRGFTPRDGFDPAELQRTTTARIWYSPAVARWEVEKGAIPLVDGAAVSERAVGSPEWLVGEVLSFRGEAVILEPAELRERVAARARELERELRPAKPRGSVRLNVAPAPGRRGDVERAAVRLGDRARDVEAEPGARLAASRCDAAELLEDQLLVLGRDPVAVVGDVDLDTRRSPRAPSTSTALARPART